MALMSPEAAFSYLFGFYFEVDHACHDLVNGLAIEDEKYHAFGSTC